ncbi:hypothetical protein [Secundilactobacillus odoratitofui]|nr:hypothetical protein [Secundilactobacillus odoratitofui]
MQQPEQQFQPSSFNQNQQSNYNYSQSPNMTSQDVNVKQSSRRMMWIVGVIVFVILLIGGYSWYESQPNVVLSKHSYYLMDPRLRQDFKWKPDVENGIMKFNFRTNGKVTIWASSDVSINAKYKINNGSLKLSLGKNNGGTHTWKLKQITSGTLNNKEYAGYLISADDSTDGDGDWLVYQK